jgi:hypothetical protein
VVSPSLVKWMTLPFGNLRSSRVKSCSRNMCSLRPLSPATPDFSGVANPRIWHFFLLSLAGEGRLVEERDGDLSEASLDDLEYDDHTEPSASDPKSVSSS